MFRILVFEETLFLPENTLFTPYKVDFAHTVEDILELTYKHTYDLYLVNMYALSTIKALKASADTTPTIFIDEFYSLGNLKKALNQGDEYLLKPLYLEDLAIRISYYYRKLFNHQKNIISYKEFYYHLHTRQLFLGTQKIKLSPNELKLLELLLLYINKPLLKDRINDTLESTSSGSLRVYISKLNKLGFEITYDRAISSYILHMQDKPCFTSTLFRS